MVGEDSNEHTNFGTYLLCSLWLWGSKLPNQLIGRSRLKVQLRLLTTFPDLRGVQDVMWSTNIFLIVARGITATLKNEKLNIKCGLGLQTFAHATLWRRYQLWADLDKRGDSVESNRPIHNTIPSFPTVPTSTSTYNWRKRSKTYHAIQNDMDEKEFPQLSYRNARSKELEKNYPICTK